MKVVAITGERRCEVREVAKPAASEEFVLVKVLAVPMCTEYKMYREGTKTDCLGHEAAGEVAEIAGSRKPRKSGRYKVGDKVVVMPLYACGRCELCVAGDYIHCQQGGWPKEGVATYAQYLLKPEAMLVPVPANVPLNHAAMTCCGLGPTFGAMQRMKVDAFDTVLITGMGPVGLGGVINATFRGARVIAVESQPYRRKLAEKLGAALTVDPTNGEALKAIMEFTGGRGVDKAVDCTGVASAQRLLIDAARRRGEVAFVGEGGALQVNVSDDMLRKGLTLHGVWHWSLTDTQRIMQVVRGSAKKIDQLITHVMPMGQVQKAWELQMTGECGKVVLEPWEE